MKIKTMKKIMLLVIIALVLFEVIFFGIHITFASNITNTETFNTSIEEQKILKLINAYRQDNGLKPLKFHGQLQGLARLKADDLAINDYFSHTSPSLGTPFEMLKNSNVMYKIAGENLAGNISEEKAVEAWINSPLHKDNILENKFQYTGISVINSDIYGKIFVQLFIGI